MNVDIFNQSQAFIRSFLSLIPNFSSSFKPSPVLSCLSVVSRFWGSENETTGGWDSYMFANTIFNTIHYALVFIRPPRALTRCTYPVGFRTKLKKENCCCRQESKAEENRDFTNPDIEKFYVFLRILNKPSSL